MARNLNNRQNKSSILKKRIPVPQKPPKVEDDKKKYDRNKIKRERRDIKDND
jgi:hypothetical protein